MDKTMTKETIEIATKEIAEEDVSTGCCGSGCGCGSNKDEAEADK